MINSNTLKLGSLYLLIALVISCTLNLVSFMLLDKMCFMTTVTALINQDSVWSLTSVIFLVFVIFRQKINLLLGMESNKNDSNKAFLLFFLIPAVMYLYSEIFFANPGYGACSMEGINIHYYESVGQDRFLIIRSASE